MMEPRTATIIATGGARAIKVMRTFSIRLGSSSDLGKTGPAFGSMVQRIRI